MKNKTQFSYPNQPVFISESATTRIRPDSPPTDFKTESVKAIFAPSLLSYPNTYIYLAIGRAVSGKQPNTSIRGLGVRAAQNGNSLATDHSEVMHGH